MNETFSLENNPFYILRVGYEVTRTEISEAVEDAIFDRQVDESSLADAQQKLVSPNQRIVAEVSYLPELSAAQVKRIHEGLERGELHLLWTEVTNYPELARANVLAHVAASGYADLALISALLEAWADLEQDDVLVFIKENRQLAGFPPPDRDTYQSALADLSRSHASAGAYGIGQSEEPGALLSAVVEQYATSDRTAALLAAMVEEYDKATEGELTRIADALEACAAAIETDPKNAAEEAEKVPGLLADWDDINQPVQLYEQARGYEEGRSRRISNRLRSVCISLANDHSDYSSASIISMALLRTFPELESLAEQLKGDVSELEKLVEQQEFEEDMEGLFSAFEVAKKNLNALAVVMKQGISSSSSFPLGRFVEEFSKIHARKEFSEMSWNLVRVLALSLNNDANNPWASWFLLDNMMSKFGGSLSAKQMAQLTDDKNMVFKNWKFGELKNTTGAGKSIKLIDEMLPFASGDEASQLRTLRSRLSGRQIWGWMKASAALAFVAFVIVPLIVDEMDTKPNRSYTPATLTRSITNTPSSSANSGTSTASASVSESRPLAGLSRALTRSELRYCLYQGERMDYLRPMIDNHDNYQIDQFNILINDLNLRCGNYRYYESDMSAVRREVGKMAGSFRKDALRIRESW